VRFDIENEFLSRLRGKIFMNINATGTVHVPAPALEDWVTAVFAHCGVPEAHARQTACVLVRTNLRGIDTHGVMRVLPYVEKLRSGEVNPKARPQAELREGVLHVDGDRGLGQVVASFAVERAVELAQTQAVVTSVIRNSGHLAALGLFVLPAAEAGMIAVLCQETPPLMALEGSTGAAIGNNPIAFAAPVAGKAPMVFDMATSIVARGNVLQAARDKVPIPEGWSIGLDGLPTTRSHGRPPGRHAAGRRPQGHRPRHAGADIGRQPLRLEQRRKLRQQGAGGKQLGRQCQRLPAGRQSRPRGRARRLRRPCCAMARHLHGRFRRSGPLSG
jgi:LDH2 family malate/lactate/ureidoglycolate dehydrogenase